MKTTSPIAGLFGRSPFSPLQRHMEVVAECAAKSVPLFEALRDGDRAGLVEVKDEVFTLEQQADGLETEIRSHLPKGLFMPVDRRDLLDLLKSQDAIADTVQDIAGLLTLREMAIPPALEGKVLPYVRRNLDAVTQCTEAINELDELLEMGFRGRARDGVEEMVVALHKIEDDTDELGMGLARDLFEQEEQMKPLSVIFWYELIQKVGNIADRAEDVGDRLRLLIAR